ncbi:MAG: ribonuclease Z [Methanobacteriaceae archaeon]
MEISFLGTSSAMPTQFRNHPAIALKAFGEVMLFDCGESTQKQLLLAKISPMKISKIFISHLHGDHILGLPGLIQSMGFRGREEPLDIYGPNGTGKVFKAIMELASSNVQFQININEININDGYNSSSNNNNNTHSNNVNSNTTTTNSSNTSNNNKRNTKALENYEPDINRLSSFTLIENDEYIVKYCKGQHNIINLAFSIEEKKKPRFLRDKAIELGVKPGPDFGRLHNGQCVTVGDEVIEPHQVLGEDRTGIKIVYSGDTTPNSNVIDLSQNCDILIHESTFNESDRDKAIENQHSTAKDAAQVAKLANASSLIITHISTRYIDSKELEKEAKEIFPKTVAAYDLMAIELKKNSETNKVEIKKIN